MTHAYETHLDHQELRPNYSEKLPTYLREHHPDIAKELDDLDIEIAVMMLDYLYDEYGGDPMSPNHRDYHDDKHTFGVIARTVWQFDFFQKKLGMPITKTDIQVGIFDASIHDSIVGISPGVPQVITRWIGGEQYTLTTDGTKTDEQLSAELAKEILKRHGYNDEILARVPAGIVLTEVDKSTEDLRPVHDIESITDPAHRAVLNADTGAIFAGGPTTMIQDISNLTAEILGKDTSDASKVIAIMMKLVHTEQKFLQLRVDMFKKMLGANAINAEAQDWLESKFDEHLKKYQDQALVFAEWLESNSTALQDHFKHEFEKLRDQAYSPARKIREGLNRALSHLPPQK